MSQDSVNINQSIGVAGNKGSIVPDSVRSYVAEGDLAFGRYLTKGTNPDTQVTYPAASADVTSLANFRGISIRDVARENNSVDILDKSMVSCLELGDIIVEPETAVTPNDGVFVRFQGGNEGKFRNDVDGGNAVALPNARWITSALANAPAFLRIVK